MQVNIGLACNLACRHCHVESSPSRKERMSRDTMQAVLSAAQATGARTLDITGGAPEMHPDFRAFIAQALGQGLRVIVRTNLTIMLEDGYTDLPGYFAARGVHLIASLPCYLPTNVDEQRGRRVYQSSIEAIQRLNRAGYGTGSDKILDLVYNPLGASLPPDERSLEATYRDVLAREHDVHFDRLITITNIPIGRFLDDLTRSGRAQEYEELLRSEFNPATLAGLMCRHQLHVGHDGTLYDCDFNYALRMPVKGPRRDVRELDPATFARRRIATGSHCFACTAGSGSSCGGALI